MRSQNETIIYLHHFFFIHCYLIEIDYYYHPNCMKSKIIQCKFYSQPFIFIVLSLIFVSFIFKVQQLSINWLTKITRYKTKRSFPSVSTNIICHSQSVGSERRPSGEWQGPWDPTYDGWNPVDSGLERLWETDLHEFPPIRVTHHSTGSHIQLRACGKTLRRI